MDTTNKIGEKIFELKNLVEVIHDLIAYSIDCGSGDCVHMLKIAEMTLQDAEQLNEDFQMYELEVFKKEI